MRTQGLSFRTTKTKTWGLRSWVFVFVGLSFRNTRSCTVGLMEFTALFNNMRTLKFKSQPTNAFFATVNQLFSGSSQPQTNAGRALIKSNRRVQFRRHCRKLGGAAEHLIDGSEKRICRFSFKFESPHVIEKRSNSA